MFDTDLNNIESKGKIDVEGDMTISSDSKLDITGVKISVKGKGDISGEDVLMTTTKYELVVEKDKQGNVISEKREYINIKHYPSEVISNKGLNITVTKNAVIENLALVSDGKMLLTVDGNVICSNVLMKAKLIKISSLESGANLTINDCAINGFAINDNYNITPEDGVTTIGDTDVCPTM